MIKDLTTSHKKENRNNRENAKIVAKDSQSRAVVVGILEEKNIYEKKLIEAKVEGFKDLVVVIPSGLSPNMLMSMIV